MDEIKKSKILIVEGKDEVSFFKAFFKHEKIEGVQIYDIGGKDNFKNDLPIFVRLSNFSRVETMAVIRDADENADQAFISIKNILKKENLTPPNQKNQFADGEPKIGIFIMPGDSDEGMLEDLCMKTIANHPILECVDEFITCVSERGVLPKNKAKAKAQVFLAAMPEIVNSVGLGALRNYWNFESDELVNLRIFIKNFR